MRKGWHGGSDTSKCHAQLFAAANCAVNNCPVMSGCYSSSVNLCKMDLFNNLPQGRSDHLEREIADQIAGEKQGSVDGE